VTVVSDNFDRSDRNPITPNWSSDATDNAMAIVSHQAVGSGGTSGAFWNADVIGDDQFSEAEIAVHPSSSFWLGVTVRAAADGTQYLLIAFNNGGTDSWMLFKRAGTGSFVQIGSTVLTAIVVGQVMRLEAEATTVTAKIGGTPIITQTDSDIAGGAPGISAAMPSTDPVNGALDNWSGGDVTADVFVPAILEYA
jgi:hypothetical protein